MNTTGVALANAERDVQNLASTIKERTAAVKEECARLATLLRSLKDWKVQQQQTYLCTRQDSSVSTASGSSTPTPTLTPTPLGDNSDHPPLPSPVSATFLKMDSDLDKVLAKARRIRSTTGSTAIHQKSSTTPTHNNKPSPHMKITVTRHHKKSVTSTSTSSPPPPPAPRSPSTPHATSSAAKSTTTTTAAAATAATTSPTTKQAGNPARPAAQPILLTLPKSENSKRARYLQQLHGRLDLSNLAQARSSLLKALDNHNHSNQKNLLPHTVQESNNHLAMFLDAMGIATQHPVPPHVCKKSRLLPPLSMKGHPLDTFMVSIAARPTADRHVWKELHQVGHAKTTDDHLWMEQKLQHIAQTQLLPELHSLVKVVNRTNSVNSVHDGSRINDEKNGESGGTGEQRQVKEMLLLYRLTESMLKRKGKKMVRIALVEEGEHFR